MTVPVSSLVCDSAKSGLLIRSSTDTFLTFCHCLELPSLHLQLLAKCRCHASFLPKPSSREEDDSRLSWQASQRLLSREATAVNDIYQNTQRD